MKQVLAVIGAVALVLVAVLVRNAMDGDDGSGGGGGGGSDVALLCPPELADACEAAGGGRGVRVEDAGTTADTLRGATDPDAVEPAVWVVPAPWVEAVRSGIEVEELVGERSDVIARSPVALVLFEDRAAALESGPCAGGIEWSCLGDAADRPWSQAGGEAGWGRVKGGVTDPTSAAGLPVLGGAAAGYFGSASFASNDFSGGFSGWLAALGADAGEAAEGDPVARMVTRGPGAFSAAGALEVTAREAAGRDGFRVLYPAPVTTADLVAVPIGDAGDAADDVAGDEQLRRALAETGWRVDDEPAAEGLDDGVALPDDDGLPSGGVMQALLDLWGSATR